MDKLWAPWREKYIRLKKQNQCIFCAAKNKKNGRYLIFKTQHSICVLNIFPYNNGHIMVSPKRHTKDFQHLNDEEILDLIKSVNKAKGLIDKTLKPQGYNIGINISKNAGAGIVGHLHIHIVPRWTGDTNFMPVIYNTKVVSQSLTRLTKLLKNAKTSVD